MTGAVSAIYSGRLAHHRRGPRAHTFAYSQRLFYLDLDELDGLLAGSWLWRRGTFWPVSFHRADYLGDAAVPLKQAVLDEVEARLGRRPEGPVRMLTHLRTFGYAFNPVTFYYCFARDGVTLQALAAEITNTPWKERHTYVIAADTPGASASFDKAFHVSPFFGMDQSYRWTFTPPGEDLAVTMVNIEHGREVFSASLKMRRRPLIAANLAGLIVRQPVAPLGVVAAIYWQALRLRLKGTPYVDHPSRAAARSAAGRMSAHADDARRP
jgi:DUF1365 family protein